MENDFTSREINQPQIQGGLPPVEKSFYQANKFYIWAVGFAVVVIAVLAFFAFRAAPPPPVKEANVQVQIQVPQTLPSGSEAVYRINIRNNDNIKLTNLELELAYPDGVAYTDSSPRAKNLSGSLFAVPDLLPGQNAALIVKAKVTGDINAEKRLLAKLHYKYSNFNSSFVKEAEQTIRLTASQVDLEIEGPKETNTVQVVMYTIKYKNNSQETIKNARIKLSYPNGFNYGSSEPPASLGGNIWNIGDLQSAKGGEISVQGTFSGSVAGEGKKLTVEFQTLGESGEYFVQNTAEAITNIISQPLLVSLENLNQHDNNVVDPGETLDFAVRYQNNAAVAATGVNILVTLDSKALDLASLQAQGGQVVGNTITWNAANVPVLESLNPSEQGTVNFLVRVKNPATKDSSKHLAINITSKIKANEYTTFLPGSGVELKVSSPAQIQAGLTYLSGSLPPKVGTRTTYKVNIKLINSSNDFSAVELTGFLPTVAGSFSQSSVNDGERDNVEFDASTGKLIWKVGLLPAHTGKFSPARILEFEVALNPSPADVGNSPSLVRNIRLTAKDNFTGQEVGAKTEDITTLSVSGQGGYSNGTVVP